MNLNQLNKDFQKLHKQNINLDYEKKVIDIPEDLNEKIFETKINLKMNNVTSSE